MPKAASINNVGRRVSILAVQVSCPECLADLAPVGGQPVRIRIAALQLIANESGRTVRCPECDTALVLTRTAELSAMVEQPDILLTVGGVGPFNYPADEKDRG